MREYGVTTRHVDGYSLSETPDQYADLVQAHKVFSSVPFMVTCCYFHEMARVIRPGGWAVFDIMTERCLSGDAMKTWSTSGVRNGAFPAAMPRAIAEELFTDHGFRLVFSKVLPMPPGHTELMCFQRSDAAVSAT